MDGSATGPCPANGLRPIDEVAGTTLVLARSRRGWRANELRTADEVVGRLRMRGVVRWSAIAEDARGTWMFKEAGFGVSVTSHAGGDEVARLVRSPAEPGGVIDVDGRRLAWTPTSAERRAWTLKEPGAELAYFRRRWPAPVGRLGVGLPSTAGRERHLGLLVLLGCYLTLTTPVLQREVRWAGDEPTLRG